MTKGESPERDSGSRGFESLQSTSLAPGCDWHRSVAVYHVNWVRFPAGALAAPVCRPGVDGSRACLKSRRTRFDSGGRHFTQYLSFRRPCSGSSLDSKSERAGFNSLTACHALVAQLEERRFRKPEAVGSNPTRGSRSTEAFCCRGREVRHLSATQDHAGSSPAGSFCFMGSYFSGRILGLHPRDPGSNPGESTPSFSGSVAQLDESTRLRTVRSQVQVLPEPLFLAPVAQLDESARFRTVRSQVQSLPGVLEASVAQWIESGRVLSARSQVRVLPEALCNTFTAERGRPPHRVSYA